MIYATGDLHGNTLRFQPQYFPEQAGMTKDDYMIVCGDFGCVWNGDKSDDPQLDRLEALPFTVLFLDGNHENFDALNEHPVEQWHGGKVHKIRPHVIHLMRGQAFKLQGCTFFTMGGAQSHDIADGILDMDSLDFYERYDSLRRNRGQFRINHIRGGWKNCRPARNMPKPSRRWNDWTGRPITSSHTAHRQRFSRKSMLISSRTG